MSKCVTAAMLGFMLGVKCRKCTGKMCHNQLKKQAMKLMGLK